MNRELSKYNPVPGKNIDIDPDGNSYIVENNIRMRQVCGSRLHNSGGQVCGNVVEKGGSCSLHESKYDDSYWEKLNRSLELPKNLKDLYKRAEGIGKDELGSTTNLLRRLTVLQWSVLGSPTGKKTDSEGNIIRVHSPAQMEYLRKMESLMLNVIDSERRVENRTLVKAQFVVKLMESVFSVISRNVSPEIAKIIVTEIGEVAFAFHEEGKIKGDIEVLETQVANFKEVIEDKKISE